MKSDMQTPTQSNVPLSAEKSAGYTPPPTDLMYDVNMLLQRCARTQAMMEYALQGSRAQVEVLKDVLVTIAGGGNRTQGTVCSGEGGLSLSEALREMSARLEGMQIVPAPAEPVPTPGFDETRAEGSR